MSLKQSNSLVPEHVQGRITTVPLADLPAYYSTHGLKPLHYTIATGVLAIGKNDEPSPKPENHLPVQPGSFIR
jgi:hypothetical protein